MTRRILVVNGHPDCRAERLCTALAESYAAGALSAGHDVQRLDVAKLVFSWLSKADEFMTPVRWALLGGVGAVSAKRRDGWLAEMRRLGARAE